MILGPWARTRPRPAKRAQKRAKTRVFEPFGRVLGPKTRVQTHPGATVQNCWFWGSLLMLMLLTSYHQ